MKKIPQKIPKDALNIALSKRVKEEKLSPAEDLQKRYNAECRKMNAARESQSMEAIRLCGDHIKAIKQAAAKLEVIIEIDAEDSWGTDRPHIEVDEAGAHFVCGDVVFKIDHEDLNKAIGTNGNPNPLERLMDSQLVALARSVGMSVQPFVRELLLYPLRGMLQAVWYRDLQGHKSEHLETQQKERVEKYHRDLAAWKPESERRDAATGERKARTASKSTKTSLLTKSFSLVKGEHPNVAAGRESDLLKAIKTIKGNATFPQIVEAAKKGSFKTKQDYEAMVARFLRELVAHGAVKEA